MPTLRTERCRHCLGQPHRASSRLSKWSAPPSRLTGYYHHTARAVDRRRCRRTVTQRLVQEPIVWIGGNISRLGDLIRMETSQKMKKAPKTGALEWNFALPQGVPKLLFLLRSSFLLWGSLFGCALHRLILPNIKFCDLEKPQCDSYIKLFTTKVKKKMHMALRFDDDSPSRVRF
jgi:hypothetical protein